MSTVHVVARGAYWRSGSREYFRALSVDGRSWNPGDGVGRLDADAAAALEAIRSGGWTGTTAAAAAYRSAGRGRWGLTGGDYTPAPGELLAVCELTAEELTELDRSGMPRAVYTRLTRSGVAPAGAAVSGALTDPVPARLRVSMRGRHGATRGVSLSAAAASVSPAPAAAAAAPVAGAPDPIERPSGEKYFPRRMPDGRTDVEMVRAIHDAGRSVLLFGAPGTGKTALLEAAFTDRGFVYVAGTSDTEAADFLGTFVPEPGGAFRWVDGPLLRAMEEGRPLVVDEIAIVDPRAMAVVYSATDGRGEVVVTANPLRGVVKARPGFGVHGACNPDAPGADMSEALLSRMTLQVEYGTDYALAGKLGAPAKLLSVARNLEKRRREGEITWSPQMRELLAWVALSRLLSPELATRNLVSSAPALDRPVVSDVLSRSFGWQVDPLTIGEAV